ncbi:hypothetical protein G6F37_011756 [Rhizopus arrhizus]|nr:hypothetical protein G6F37_011756 [Rhizopus arrhizus]
MPWPASSTTNNGFLRNSMTHFPRLATLTCQTSLINHLPQAKIPPTLMTQTTSTCSPMKNLLSLVIALLLPCVTTPNKIQDYLGRILHIWYTTELYHGYWTAWSGSSAKYSLSIVLASKILIYCLYLPPSLDDDEVTTILDILPLQYVNTTNTILCGDFNARLGPYTGDTRIDPRERIFYNWMCSHNLILWNQRLTHGQPTSYTFQGTSIIDFFLSNNELISPSIHIRHDLSLNSNHKFMSMSFDLPSNLQVHLPPQRVTWNIGKLKHPRFRNSYKEVFTENLQIILPHQSSLSFPNRTEACQYIDSIHQQLCDTIYDSLDKICGRRSPPTDEWLKDYWTTEMTAAFNRKECYYKKWRKAHGFNALRLWVAHQEAQAKLRQLILKRRRETWRCFCDQMSQGNYSKAIAKFSRIRKNRTIKPTFSHIQGPQRAADVMAQHLQRTFAGDLLSNFTESTPSISHNEPFGTNTCPFTIETVNDAIAHLPEEKHPV